MKAGNIAPRDATVVSIVVRPKKVQIAPSICGPDGLKSIYS